jgi:hypothetical protein
MDQQKLENIRMDVSRVRKNAMLVELGQYFMQKDLDRIRNDTRVMDRKLLHMQKQLLNPRYHWVLWEIRRYYKP